MSKESLNPNFRFSEFRDDWILGILKDLSHKIMVGIASSATHAYREKGVILFRNQNIKEGFLEDKNILFIDEEYEKNIRINA